MAPKKPAPPMRLAERVQENTKKIRERKGLSRDRLAFQSGLSTSYIIAIESKRRSPPLDTIEDLAKGLGVDSLELLAIPQ